MMDFLEQKLLPPMSKLAEQKHLRAMRNGIVSTVPIVIIGSIFLIILNLPLDPLGINWKTDVLDAINPQLQTHLLMAFRLTTGLMALYAAFGIGVALGKEYELDPTISGLAATIGFLFSIVPATVTGDMVTAMTDAGLEPLAGGQYLAVSALGSGSLFGAMIYAMLSVEIIRLFKKYNLTIRMPESVPTAIANSFANIFSIGFVVILVWVIRHILGFDLNAFIGTLLSPIQGFLTGDNIFGQIFIVMLTGLFWCFGLHGASLVGTVVRPFWEQAITENMDAFLATKNASISAAPHVFPEQFLQWYVYIGGAGATLGLCFLLVFFAKSQFLKQMGKVTIIPAIFNINEPVIFGLPIVMNPILMIPFVFVPVIMTIFAGLLQKIGFMNAMVLRAPWTLPGPLGAWMSTNWDIKAMLVAFLCIAISIVCWYPFFKAYDKKLLAEEEATVTE